MLSIFDQKGLKKIEKILKKTCPDFKTDTVAAWVAGYKLNSFQENDIMKRGLINGSIINFDDKKNKPVIDSFCEAAVRLSLK